MDILIKNIDRDSLPRQVIIYPNGDVEELREGKYEKVSEAIELPPHGRCIDADALIESFNKNITAEGWTLHQTFEKILNAPTVLEAST